MVDFNGINDLSKLNSINNIQGTTAAHIVKTESNVGVFGNGFISSSAGFERKVVPEFLANKFANVEVPKYNKNIPQLVINDKDYIPDKSFEEERFCEV